MSRNIIMPEMGEGVIEGTIVKWLKHKGDAVKQDEPILELETDKVTVEVTSEIDGVLLSVNADEGETVSVGTLLAVIGEAHEVIETAPVSEASVATAANQQPTPQKISQSANHIASSASQTTSSRSFDGVRVSPVVARMLQIHDLDVNELNGTGREGRITKKDVLAYLETQEDAVEEHVSEKPTAPLKPSVIEDITVSQNAEDTLLPLTGMRRSIADHMVKSVQTSPHVTTFFEFDFTQVAKHREAHKEQFAQDGIKLTYMPYIVMATVQALKKHPIVNASWTDEGILLKRDIHLGMAVAVPSGLIVPVIKNADGMNLLGLARMVNTLSDRARNNQLKPDDVKGGTFTISNHGASGSLMGTPIINQPQVGILGVGMIEKRLKIIEDAIMIRTCAYVSFSFDHRILDGATADAFVMDIKNSIEHFNTQ